MSTGGKGGVQTGGSIFDNSADWFNKAAQGTAGSFNNLAAMGAYNPKLNKTSIANASQLGPSAMVADPATIQSGIAGYMNPYTDSVINNSIADVNRLTQQQQVQNAADAAHAGAFGGSRHGLVEAETNRNAQQTIADLVGNLRYQGYNNAAGLSAQDIANKTNVDTTNANIGNTFTLADKAANDAFAQFNANSINSNRDFRRQLGLQANELGLNAAGQLGQLGAGGVDIGRALNSDLLNAGNAQQGILQQIIDAAAGNFGGYVNQGQSLLNTVGAAVTGSPLAGATTTTGSYRPGLLDYLGLGAQTAATLYNPAKTATGGKK